MTLTPHAAIVMRLDALQRGELHSNFTTEQHIIAIENWIDDVGPILPANLYNRFQRVTRATLEHLQGEM